MTLPKGYQTVMPYLILQDVEGFIKFTKDVFGARELSVHRRENGDVMHAEITIGTSTIMMGQVNDAWSTQNAGLYINVDDVDATFLKATKAGATVILEIEDKPYGRSGGVVDPFGNTWWITTPPQ